MIQIAINSTRGVLAVAILLVLTAFLSTPSVAQCPYQLATNVSGTTITSSPSGISFEVTALQNTKICRIWAALPAGPQTVEIWYNPTGLILVPNNTNGANPNGWVSLGIANAVGNGTGLNYAELPLDLNLMMEPGDKFGFALVPVAPSTAVYYQSGTPYVFSDSYISINTQGWSGNVPAKFINSGAPGALIFNRRFAGRIVYDEGCYFPDNILKYELLDELLQPTSFANVPGAVNLKYSVSYPDEDASIGVTVNLRNVITDAVVHTHIFTINKPAGQPAEGIELIPLPAGLPSGYFKVEVIFNTKNSCMNYEDYLAPPSTLLLLPPGATMCIVWPGDVNNDGVVNYGDRSSLNGYIYDANLRSSWLEGPTRFSVQGGLDYIAWKSQPGAPWQTAEGCYMDSDGNGVVNNFDYIAIKMNWMRSHAGIPPKMRETFSSLTFDMDQNYPNPFNPSTSIRYAVPERSQVRLVVTDMLGRTVATLVDAAIEAGVHHATFDAAGLPSGSYIATVQMTGLESGLTFSKTINMALSK